MNKLGLGFFSGMRFAEKVFLGSLSLAISTILLDQNINNPLLGIMVISWFFVPKPKGYLRSGISDNWVLTCWAFYAVYIIGMSYTENISSGLSQLETKLGLVIFPFLISSYGRWNWEKRNFLLFVLGVSLLMLALISLGSAWHQSYKVSGSIMELMSEFFVYNKLVRFVNIQPLYMSLFVIFFLVGLQLIMIREWNDWGSRKRMLALGLDLFLIAFLLLLSSRTSVVTYFIWAVLRTLVLVYQKKQLKESLVMLTVEGMLALILLTQLNVNKTRFSEALDPDSDFQTDQYAGRSLRLEKWKCAMEVWRKEPIIGVGTGDENATLLECFKSKNIEEAIRFGYNSHNQYLSTLTQVGIIGLFALLALVLFPLWKGYKERDLMIFAVGMVFLLCMGSETMLSRRIGVLFCSLVLSIWFVAPVMGSSGRSKGT